MDWVRGVNLKDCWKNERDREEGKRKTKCQTSRLIDKKKVWMWDLEVSGTEFVHAGYICILPSFSAVSDVQE